MGIDNSEVNNWRQINLKYSLSMSYKREYNGSCF